MPDAIPARRFEEPITVKTAAQFLGVSPSLVYAYVERKQIPHHRMMGRSDARRIQQATEKSKELRTALLATRELLRIVAMLAAIRPPERPENIPLVVVRVVAPGDIDSSARVRPNEEQAVSAACPLPTEEYVSGRGGAGPK